MLQHLKLKNKTKDLYFFADWSRFLGKRYLIFTFAWLLQFIFTWSLNMYLNLSIISVEVFYFVEILVTIYEAKLIVAIRKQNLIRVTFSNLIFNEKKYFCSLKREFSFTLTDTINNESLICSFIK